MAAARQAPATQSGRNLFDWAEDEPKKQPEPEPTSASDPTPEPALTYTTNASRSVNNVLTREAALDLLISRKDSVEVTGPNGMVNAGIAGSAQYIVAWSVPDGASRMHHQRIVADPEAALSGAEAISRGVHPNDVVWQPRSPRPAQAALDNAHEIVAEALPEIVDAIQGANGVFHLYRPLVDELMSGLAENVSMGNSHWLLYKSYQITTTIGKWRSVLKITPKAWKDHVANTEWSVVANLLQKLGDDQSLMRTLRAGWEADHPEELDELERRRAEKRAASEARSKRRRALREGRAKRAADVEQRRDADVAAIPHLPDRSALAPIPKGDEDAASWLREHGMHVIEGYFGKWKLRSPRKGELRAVAGAFRVMQTVLGERLPTERLFIGFYGKKVTAGGALAECCTMDKYQPSAAVTCMRFAGDQGASLVHEYMHYLEVRNGFPYLTNALDTTEGRLFVTKQKIDGGLYVPVVPRYLSYLGKTGEMRARLLNQYVADKLVEGGHVLQSGNADAVGTIAQAIVDHVYDADTGEPKLGFFVSGVKEKLYEALERDLRAAGILSSVQKAIAQLAGDGGAGLRVRLRGGARRLVARIGAARTTRTNTHPATEEPA